MKKSFFLMALALAAFSFVSCDKKDNKQDLDNVIEDGFYCVGPATAIESIEAKDLNKALLGAGFNEATKEKRAGMYEKYVALEADKEFMLVLHKEGQSDDVYGAELEEKEAVTDNAEIQVMMYWGQLVPNKTMKVAKSGLYHIILDLNEIGDLDATGGKQIAITPVNWGIRGGFIDASWSQTRLADVTTDFNKQTMTATWNEVEVSKGSAFKFISQNCWKIQLDMSGQVKAETSIGQVNGELTTFGEEINIPIERGVWKIVLDWNLAGGALGKSFTYSATKVRDLEAADYSNSELVLVGDGVVEESAQEDYAKEDGGWPWGKLYSMGKPAKDGDVYTWTVDRVRLSTAGFKFRSNKTTDVPYLEFGMNGGKDNIILEVESDYKVVVTIDAAKDTYTTEFTKLGDEEAQKQIITVKFKLPADWTNTPTAWVWPTGGEGQVAALTQNGDWWVYTTPEEVVELNIIVRNGDDWDHGQTANIEHIKADVCYQITTEGDEKGHLLATEIDCE